MFVEFVECAVPDLYSSPDRWLGFKQHDLELVESLRGWNRADACGVFEGFANGIDDMPQRVSDHARVGMGASGFRLLFDRFEFDDGEGDCAWVLFVELQSVGELRHEIGDDLALGLGEEDVVRRRWHLG